MAAECPVVVSDTGGLGEIITHKYNGMKILTGLVDSLRDNIVEILKNEELASDLKKNGFEDVYVKYTWDKVAEHTVHMYERVKEEESEVVKYKSNGDSAKAAVFSGLSINDIYR